MTAEQDDEVAEAIQRLLSVNREPKKTARRNRGKSAPSLIVAKETIRRVGGDHGVTAKLELYQVLNTPLPLTRAPSIKAIDALRTKAPQAGALLDELSLDLRFAGRQAQLPQQRILLWGEPGAGKSWLAKRLLSSLTSSWISYAAGGASSALDLVGQSPTYRDADAGLPARAIMKTRLANPGILCDEVDKFGSSDWNGSPTMALNGFCERENSEKLYDPFLQVHIDCSRVHWIFTANEIRNLPRPLLSRLRVFEMKRPGEEALDAIIEGFRNDLAANFGLKVSQLPSVDDLLRLKVSRQLKARDDLRKIRAMFDQEFKHRAIASRTSQHTVVTPALRPAPQLVQTPRRGA